MDEIEKLQDELVKELSIANEHLSKALDVCESIEKLTKGENNEEENDES